MTRAQLLFKLADLSAEELSVLWDAYQSAKITGVGCIQRSAAGRYSNVESLNIMFLHPGVPSGASLN